MSLVPELTEDDFEIFSDSVKGIDNILSKIDQIDPLYKLRMFQHAGYFLMEKLTERSGALLRSYLMSMYTEGVLDSPLVYAGPVEAMSGVTWTKGTAIDHAIAQCREYMGRIKKEVLHNVIEDELGMDDK